MPGHGWTVPDGLSLWRWCLQDNQHLLAKVRAIPPRLTRARAIHQPAQSFTIEPPPPIDHGIRAHVQPARNVADRVSLHALQNDLGSLH